MLKQPLKPRDRSRMPTPTIQDSYQAIVARLPAAPAQAADDILPDEAAIPAGALDQARWDYTNDGNLDALATIRALRDPAHNSLHTTHCDTDQWLISIAARRNFPAALDHMLALVGRDLPEATIHQIVQRVAESGMVDALKDMKARGFDIIQREYGHTPFCRAAAAGHLDVVKYYDSLGVRNLDTAAYNAAQNGHVDVYRHLVEAHEGLDAPVHLTLAVGQHSSALLDYIVSREPSAVAFEKAMLHACENNLLPMVVKLHDAGKIDLSVSGPALIHKAAYYQAWPVVDYLYRQAVELVTDRTYDLKVFNLIKTWHKRHGDCPPGLAAHSPFHFRSAAFHALAPLLAAEGYKPEIGNIYAYKGAALFGTADRVLTYLNKWGQAGKQSLHDVLQHIDIPDGRFNNAAWADAVLRHGPKMARLVKFADQMAEPEKDPKGQWSYTRTRSAIAQKAYGRGNEHPELAALCFEMDWSEKQFEAALTLVQEYQPKTGAKIPDITIDGAAFAKPGYLFRKLPDGDPRGLLLGEFTDCCQHLAGEGKECARHGFTSKNAGFYVIEEQKTGAIVAQSWAWRGKGGELVFDSLETLGGHMRPAQWRSLCDEFAAQAQDKINIKAKITAITIGTGGATPSLGLPAVENPAQPVDYTGYRDSKQQMRLWPR